MKFIPTIKACIRNDVKKAFHCEVINQAVYEQIEEALNQGRVPEFQDVTCECNHGSEHGACRYTGEEITEMLTFNGVMSKCRQYLAPNFNDEGEWR